MQLPRMKVFPIFWCFQGKQKLIYLDSLNIRIEIWSQTLKNFADDAAKIVLIIAVTFTECQVEVLRL